MGRREQKLELRLSTQEAQVEVRTHTSKNESKDYSGDDGLHCDDVGCYNDARGKPGPLLYDF